MSISKTTKNKIFSLYHFLWSFFGALFFGFPSRRLFVLGVTGTKGKSTALELINAILEKAGKKTALLSSVRIKIAEKSQKNMRGNTMPGRAFIQKFLRQAVKNKCDFTLIEVTSQGVLQHRHRFIDWDAALFTNLAPEHIEAHGGFENYRRAKLDFFTYAKKSGISKKTPKLFFVNQDDPNARFFVEAGQGGKIILYSKKSVLDSEFPPPAGELNSKFFPENTAAAVSFCRAIGINDEIIEKAIKNFPGVPGRMEIVQTEPFAVIIDYAHTPDSLLKIYETIKNTRLRSSTDKPNPKLVCVLGSAGGGRDKWKRPKMGEIASRHCDEIVLTNEDPYDENPEKIIDEIFSGFSNPKSVVAKDDSPECQTPNPKSCYRIVDRKEAIGKALSLAKKGDTVIITGKGCEPWLHLAKGEKIPWDEKEIVKEEIKKIDKNGKK